MMQDPQPLWRKSELNGRSRTQIGKDAWCTDSKEQGNQVCGLEKEQLKGKRGKKIGDQGVLEDLTKHCKSSSNSNKYLTSHRQREHIRGLQYILPQAAGLQNVRSVQPVELIRKIQNLVKWEKKNTKIQIPNQPTGKRGKHQLT